MSRLTILVALALTLAVGAEAAKPKPPKPTTGKSTITKTHAPKSAATKGAAATKSSSVKATGAQAKASTGKSAKPAKSDAKLAKADAKAATKSAKADQKTNRKGTDASSSDTASNSTGAGTSSATSTSTDTIDFAATGLGPKLQKNDALRSKIEAKLQAAGYTGTVYEAAYGFKNLGQLNAATNQVQNQGSSFEVLKVLMTGTYVDPDTHLVYRANQLPDGTVQLVSPELATNPASTQSLGQAKQAITAGAEMPEIILVQTTATTSGTSSATAPTSKRKSTS